MRLVPGEIFRLESESRFGRADEFGERANGSAEDGIAGFKDF